MEKGVKILKKFIEIELDMPFIDLLPKHRDKYAHVTFSLIIKSEIENIFNKMLLFFCLKGKQSNKYFFNLKKKIMQKQQFS